MALKFNCSKCGNQIIAKFSKVGEVKKCQKCVSTFVLFANAKEKNSSKTSKESQLQYICVNCKADVSVEDLICSKCGSEICSIAEVPPIIKTIGMLQLVTQILAFPVGIVLLAAYQGLRRENPSTAWAVLVVGITAVILFRIGLGKYYKSLESRFIKVKDVVQIKEANKNNLKPVRTKESDVEYICSDCGVDVSEEDKICPTCGADLSKIEE